MGYMQGVHGYHAWCYRGIVHGYHAGATGGVYMGTGGMVYGVPCRLYVGYVQGIHGVPGRVHGYHAGSLAVVLPCWVQVHMQNVTVYADEHAALQLVSQGSVQNAGRRNSRSKQEPLELIERRRSHSRASTPSAKDMQTGAPSLDFQIM